jgi:hypothetical protein
MPLGELKEAFQQLSYEVVCRRLWEGDAQKTISGFTTHCGDVTQSNSKRLPANQSWGSPFAAKMDSFHSEITAGNQVQGGIDLKYGGVVTYSKR